MSKIAQIAALMGRLKMPYRQIPRWDPHRYLVHAEVSLGRRGSVLALLGGLWLLVGVSCVVVPPSGDYWLLSGDGWPRAIGWFVTGAVAIYYARKEQGKDALGFLALYLMAAFRIAAYGLAFILWVTPGGNPGTPRGLVGATTWVAVVLLIVIVAGWREPSHEKRGDPR